MMESNTSKNQGQLPSTAGAASVLGERFFWLGLMGAVVGGVVGYFLFYVFAKRGLILPVLPGAFVGLGREVFSRRRSWLLGGICGVGGLAVGVYTVNHILEKGIQSASAVMFIAIAAGAALAFWFGLGRTENA